MARQLITTPATVALEYIEETFLVDGSLYDVIIEETTITSPQGSEPGYYIELLTAQGGIYVVMSASLEVRGSGPV